MITYDLKNLSYLKLLLSIEGIGPQKIFSLLSSFKNFEKIFNANYKELSEVEGISSILSTRILKASHQAGIIEENLVNELERLEKLNTRLISYWDAGYPDLLKKIYYPPLILYVKGEFDQQDSTSIAIVGTRNPSTYGKVIAEKFAQELAEKRISIVSGLARGIDSIAHSNAMKAKGRTIAVIGTGIDVIYPPENKKITEEIFEKGVIISEFELGTKPDAQNFPRRNRIISGISLGTLVIETKISGGAMQTAAYALDQNREVFAVPGNINVKQSEGPNALIQKGEAKLVSCIEDILYELNLKLRPEIGKNIPQPSFELNLFEEKILSILNTEALQIDEITNLSLMSTSDCLVNLLTLEFKGLVKQLPGKNFIRC